MWKNEKDYHKMYKRHNLTICNDKELKEVQDTRQID